MALIHQVYDTDAHFKIDPVTRVIRNESSGKNVLIQGDHNSERFTFEIPKLIDGHDMSKCNSVQVHYINIDSNDKTLKSEDAHDVDDLQISPEDENVVICSWLIDGKATKYAGSLAFLLKFKCIGADGSASYVWNTARYTNISISSGMDNGDAIVEEHSDILAQWEARIAAVEESHGSSVTYTPQILTDEQKAQARENIGAANGEEFAQITLTVKGELKPFINALNFNDPDVETGGLYDYDGVWTAYPGYNSSGYIPVTGSRLYIYKTTGAFLNNRVIVWFGENKNRIAGSMSSSNPFYVVPTNAAYVRLPFQDSERDNETVIAFFANEEDEVPDGGFEYAPYNEVIFTTGQKGLTHKVEDLEKAVEEITEAEEITKWNGKSWYAYGTSITDVDVGTGKYVPYLVQMSGMVCTNKGIGGGGITPNIGGYSRGQVKNAIMNTTDGKTNADLITLEVGANEVGAPIGTVYDTDDTTYCGCLNQCLRYLQANTNAQILVIASPSSTTLPDPESEGNSFVMLEATERVCKLNNVNFLGRCNNMGWAKITAPGQSYIVDNIHQSELGGYNQAAYMWEKIKTLPLFYAALPE